MEVKERIERLEKYWKHKSVNINYNILCITNDFPKDYYLDIIKQYSIFSSQAIHMLLNAAIRNHDWELLREEILENIQEELGSHTFQVPHLEFMRQGYREELFFDPDQVIPWNCTKGFLSAMHQAFKHDDNAWSAGAVYAFEFHAIQEFHILENLFFKVTSKSVEELKKTSLVLYYIRGHKDFEIGHAQNLLDAIIPYLTTEENMSKFEKGFHYVSSCLSKWWCDLHEHYGYKELIELSPVLIDLKKIILSEE